MSPSFLQGLMQTKVTASASDVIARATGGSTYGGSRGVGHGIGLGPAGPWDVDAAVRNGYERVIWVFRCVDVIAQNQARLTIDLKKGLDRRHGPTIDDPRLGKLLNFRANSYETSKQFRYRLSSQLLLSRRGAFVEIVLGRDQRPSELHLLPAGSTEPIPDQKIFVSGYKVQRADFKYDILKPEQVIWIRLKPHPTDPYAQMTPLVAAGIEADTDFLARIFNRNFLANDGRPGMLITIDGGAQGMNPEDASTIKRRFNGGPANAGQTTVIEGAGLQVQDLGAQPRDVQWSEMLATSKERLLMAFGVPESVMGNASGRTFDNADAERENFWLDTMTDHCDTIAAALDPLSGDITDDTVFGYRYDEVDVLQRAATARRAEWLRDVQAGVKSIDDYLVLCGDKPWDVVGTRILVLPIGLLIAKNPADQEEANKMAPIGSPAMQGQGGGVPNGAGGPPAVNGVQQSQTEAITSGVVRGVNNQISARVFQLATGQKMAELDAQEIKEDIIEGFVVAEEKVHPYLGARHRMEGSIEGILIGWDDRQEKVITERLMHVKSRKGTRHWEGDIEEKKLPDKQKCKYCDNQATKRIIHAEGMAYIPVCDSHLEKGKNAAAHSTPDGSNDPSNIDGIRDIKSLDPYYAVETDRWVAELKDTMTVVITEAIKKEASRAALDLKNRGVLSTMVDNGWATGTGAGASKAFLTPRSAQDALEAQIKATVDIVEGAARRQSQRVAQRITEMDDEGASMRQIEMAVKQMIGIRSQWRKTLATNVVTSAMEGAKHTVYGQAQDLLEKNWNTMDDERVRRTHNELGESKSIPVDQDFVTSGGVHISHPGSPLAPPGETINCFPADTVVQAGSVDGAYRRYYEGSMFEVVTREGKHLTGTPNHPILTAKGWVPLQFLAEGDDLVCYVGNDQAPVGENVDARPAHIGQVFDTFAMSNDLVRVTGSGVNFHGDLAEHGDVDVVLANRPLQNDAVTTADEFVSKFLFPKSDPVLGSLKTDSAVDQGALGILGATPSSVGSSDQGSSLLRSGLTHSSEHGVTSVSGGNVITQEKRSESETAYAILAGKSLLGLTGEVSLDDVVSVKRIENWFGHVYNLSTGTGAYVSNGIVAHNCRCWVTVSIAD